MALTAARSELNVAIVGESDVADALAKTKAEMQALEAKVRSLTGATKAQNSAVEASGSPLATANGAMTGLAKKAEGLVEGVDKVKGAFNKVVESAGFIGMAVSGAITAFEFLRDIFDDSAEEAAKLQKQMAATQARTDAFKASVDRLTSSMRSMQAATGQGAVALRQESAQLLELQGKIDEARFEREGATIEQAKLRESELRAESDKTAKEFYFARAKMIDAEIKLRDAKIKFAEEDERLSLKESRALAKGQIVKLDAIKAERALKKAAHTAEVIQQSTLFGIAKESMKANEEAFIQLEERAGLAKQITSQMLENLGKFGQVMPIEEMVKGGGGGGAAKQAIIDLLAAREEERQQFLAWLKETQAETAAVNKARADGIKADAERRAAVKDEAALFDELGVMRAKVSRELAELPTTGVTADAFKGLREQLAKQLADIDRLMGARVAASRDGAMTTAEEDAITAALTKQREEMEKLVGTMGSLSEARTKSNEEARQMAEAARRSLPVERMNELKDGIDQLQQMSVPAFSDIATVVGQVSEQFQRYKDKQTDMTGAAINSASAIAGSIAKQIGGVKAEAGVRALFELAMGFATLVNPVESAGHFSAAALFGLVAGGVIKSGAAAGAGGQKAPATRAAQTQQVGGATGGGGNITNVYNLQTGIVDGQSTAQAFRRAEQQARNTGMATAGGW